ncbi:glycoside hydrolase superfamily [Dichotomocladium elegans]|nr:glycoside hydrolase superfamily [Dichotomocladium elegans]
MEFSLRETFRSHVAYSYFAIRQAASEISLSNEVYVGALTWSGSWEITMPMSLLEYTCVVIKIRHQDFGWTLEPGLAQVQEYLYDRISTLAQEIGINYIKWDMNRPWAEDRNPRGAWALAVRGFYSIIDRLRAAHPSLWSESCASGGGHVDIGVQEMTHQVYGASLFLPPHAMYAWVSDSPWDPHIQIPLSFRIHVSFMGGLGVGPNLNGLSEEQLAECREWISLHEKLRPTIQDGDLDWLVKPSRMSELVAVSQTTAHDRSQAPNFLLIVSTAPLQPL